MNLDLIGKKISNQEDIFIVGQVKLFSIQLKKKSKETSFELDRIEFEELIQLDVACSHWANAPEEIRRLFELCRRPQLIR